MRKLAITIVVLAVLAGSLYAFRAPIMEALMERLTADMFVPADTDEYDPGVAVGAMLPPLRATYNGNEVNDVAGFMGERGVALYAIRSVDW